MLFLHFLNKLTKRQKNSCGDAVFRCITCLTVYHNGIGLLWKLLQKFYGNVIELL